MDALTRRGFLKAVGGAAVVGTAWAGARAAEGGREDAAGKKALTSAPRLADVSDVVRGVHGKHRVPGLVGAIVDRGGPIAQGAAGIRKVGSAERMTAWDQIHLGSCTKAMTATLVGRLVERGGLRLGARMREVFPKLAGRMNGEMADVTVGQVLNHTAGLPANVGWWSFEQGRGRLPASRLKVVEQVLSAAPAQRPGTKFVYSNVGYMVLGSIVEEAAGGRAWEDVIGAEVFKPLRMASGGFGPPGAAGRVDQPWGHTVSGNTMSPVQNDNAPVLGPAGRVHCTIGDWGRYVGWCLRAWREDTPILKSATHRLMLTPEPGSEYMSGWGITKRDWAGGLALTHSGSNTMWYCVAWLAPEKGFAVLAATNVAGDDAAKACDEVSAALIGRRGEMAANDAVPAGRD